MNSGVKLFDKFPFSRCCKLPPPDFGYDGIDQLERISCKISKEDFFDKYVSRREPIMLTGCQTNWTASTWTFEGDLRFKLYLLSVFYEVA